MNPLPFDPMKYAPDEPKSAQRTINFKDATYLGKETYKLIPGIITLSSPPKSTVDYFFNYPFHEGEEQFGRVMVPYTGLFVPKDGSDHTFIIRSDDENKITLKSRDDITAGGYKMDGTLEFIFTVYNYRTDTFVIGNSPPKMKVGP